MPGFELNNHMDITFCNNNHKTIEETDTLFYVNSNNQDASIMAAKIPVHHIRSNKHIHLFYLKNLSLFFALIRVNLIILFDYKYKK